MLLNTVGMCEHQNQNCSDRAALSIIDGSALLPWSVLSSQRDSPCYSVSHVVLSTTTWLTTAFEMDLFLYISISRYINACVPPTEAFWPALNSQLDQWQYSKWERAFKNLRISSDSDPLSVVPGEQVHVSKARSPCLTINKCYCEFMYSFGVCVCVNVCVLFQHVF